MIFNWIFPVVPNGVWSSQGGMLPQRRFIDPEIDKSLHIYVYMTHFVYYSFIQ